MTRPLTSKARSTAVTKRDAERLERSHRVWKLVLGCATHEEIARIEGIASADVRQAVNDARTVLGIGGTAGVDVEAIRRLEADRLDALQRAWWPAATGELINEFLIKTAREGIDDNFGTVLKRLISESQGAAHLVLEVMRHRRRLFGIDTVAPEQPVMPTVIFGSPTDWRCDHPALEVTTAPSVDRTGCA